jgi:hypothetical protein
MKVILIVVSILGGLFIIFQTYTTMATNKTETQKYNVVTVEEDFEIRHYPSATMAMISSSARTYQELRSPGFRKLAGYIFGGNNEKKQIAMTSPVHMDISDSGSTMGFVMPAKFTKENLPIPTDPGVTIKIIPEEYVAAIRFGGFASDASIKRHKDLLESGLRKKGISYYGHFRYLGYNPPFQLLGRRNEIIVAINWNK